MTSATVVSTSVELERQAADEKLRLLEGAREQLGQAFSAASAEALAKNNEAFLHLAKQNLEVFQERARGDLDAREKAIGDLVADMELARSRRDVPIDAANVVTRLIRPRFARLTAVTGRDALMLAVQLTVEATIDGELERAQQFGNRCGGRPAGPLDRHPQLRGKASFGFGDTHIVGTVLSTRLRTCSMEMSRASAS